MSLILTLVLGWVVLVVALFAKHTTTLRALWREPMFAQPVVIVESDDWGPGPESDAHMLDRIAAVLSAVSDGRGNPAVMTLGVVLGRPDGAAILADECVRYHRDTLEGARYAPIVQAMRMGCAGGVFALQRHGLEHFWPDSLLERARGDEALRRWLADPAARSETLPSELQSRWVDAATLPSRPLPEAEVEAAILEEAETLRRVFGELPTVAVPNTFVWNRSVERAWAAHGVTCIVTCGRQYEGRNAEGGLIPPTKQIFNAEAACPGVHYVVRDAYFEPIRGHRAEQVWQAVAEHAALARPTLLETHRENFIAPDEISARSLSELDRALRGLVLRHSGLHFLSTAALARVMTDRSHPLVLARTSARLRFFLRRVLAAPSLSRSLKLTGLRFVLPALAR